MVNHRPRVWDSRSGSAAWRSATHWNSTTPVRTRTCSPGIARYHPHLTDTFARLADEHRTVARIQGALVALLADIGIADPERFRAELDRMSMELNAHLDDEEEQILPLLAEVPWPPAPPAPAVP